MSSSTCFRRTSTFPWKPVTSSTRLVTTAMFWPSTRCAYEDEVSRHSTPSLTTASCTSARQLPRANTPHSSPASTRAPSRSRNEVPDAMAGTASLSPAAGAASSFFFLMSPQPSSVSAVAGSKGRSVSGAGSSCRTCCGDSSPSGSALLSSGLCTGAEAGCVTWRVCTSFTTVAFPFAMSSFIASRRCTSSSGLVRKRRDERRDTNSSSSKRGDIE